MQLLTFISLSILSLLPSAVLAQDAAQETITLYGFRPTGTAALSGDQEAINALIDNKQLVNVSPVAVDKSGYTLYQAIQANTVVAEINANGIRTRHLPTPTTVTYTFRADASRIHQALQTDFKVQDVKISVKIVGECSHDVDSDTPPADGGIVCMNDAVLKGEGNGRKTATTIQLTETGSPDPFYTLTQAANLSLPTVDVFGRADSLEGLGMVKLGMMMTGLVAVVQFVL